MMRPTKEQVERWLRTAAWRADFDVAELCRSYLELLEENKELRKTIDFWKQERDVLVKEK